MQKNRTKLNRIIIIGGISCAWFGSQASAQSIVSGSGARGEVTQSLPAIGPAALLSSFDLNFGFGNDHQLTRVKVFPIEARRTVAIAYNDKNSDDAYSYHAGFVLHPDQVYTNELSGQCRGSCSTPVQVPAGHTFVLRGFDMRFLSSDHHIRTLGIEHASNQLRIYMSDKNGDDAFAYRIRFAILPNSYFSAISQSSGIAAGVAQTSMFSGRTVIRGFMFNFNNSDHHISRIRIAPDSGTLRVAYHGKNADDPFSWRVHWANLN
jgi:hypothetical protein